MSTGFVHRVFPSGQLYGVRRSMRVIFINCKILRNVAKTIFNDAVFPAAAKENKGTSFGGVG
jgi:hypothetical protein